MQATYQVDSCWLWLHDTQHQFKLCQMQKSLTKSTEITSSKHFIFSGSQALRSRQPIPGLVSEAKSSPERTFQQWTQHHGYGSFHLTKSCAVLSKILYQFFRFLRFNKPTKILFNHSIMFKWQTHPLLQILHIQMWIHLIQACLGEQRQQRSIEAETVTEHLQCHFQLQISCTSWPCSTGYNQIFELHSIHSNKQISSIFRCYLSPDLFLESWRTKAQGRKIKSQHAFPVQKKV